MTLLYQMAYMNLITCASILTPNSTTRGCLTGCMSDRACATPRQMVGRLSAVGWRRRTGTAAPRMRVAYPQVVVFFSWHSSEKPRSRRGAETINLFFAVKVQNPDRLIGPEDWLILTCSENSRAWEERGHTKESTATELNVQWLRFVEILNFMNSIVKLF